MSCQHGNHDEHCELCDALDAAYESGRVAGAAKISDEIAYIRAALVSVKNWDVERTLENIKLTGELDFKLPQRIREQVQAALERDEVLLMNDDTELAITDAIRLLNATGAYYTANRLGLVLKLLRGDEGKAPLRREDV